jgi:type IV pilus assembly protein PilA
MDREEDGFTLIELMVVVLIIAILIAIAIPTFLGARERAQERAAQSSVRNAFTAAKTLFTDSESYTPLTNAVLEGVEPSLDYFGGVDVSDAAALVAVDPAETVSPNNITWDVATTSVADDTVVIAAVARNDHCFFVREIAAGATAGTSYAERVGGACDADAIAGLTWNSEW